MSLFLEPCYRINNWPWPGHAEECPVVGLGSVQREVEGGVGPSHMLERERGRERARAVRCMHKCKSSVCVTFESLFISTFLSIPRRDRVCVCAGVHFQQGAAVPCILWSPDAAAARNSVLENARWSVVAVVVD